MRSNIRRLRRRHMRRAQCTRLVRHLRDEARALKEVVAEQTLELRLLKKNMIGDGGDPA
ncbi:hypothetical protein AA0498_2590 [Acidomonas methanolica]|nr:hypothetical protein AA0498_2590 [Acidomonas methanolica]